ncbi:MAG: Gfo/Idh/MocA family oxidoreductase [Eubacterium sp.]|nr:Gfo/Idh/MocA family oxidoreductase [Eubacterium sp.]
MKRLRVVVCGAVFGRYYLEGLKLLPDQYELVGILGRGGEGSRRAAERYKVPLYTDINEITGEITDVVCVVVKSTIIGGRGTEIAKQLLARGIHVIQEQPVHLKDYQECLRIAHANNCKYSMNTFYPDLSGIREMLKICGKLRKENAISYIRAECSIQLLFPMLDILGKALGGLSGCALEACRTERKQRFRILNGVIRDIPVMLTVDNQIDLGAKESNLTMFHRLQIGTPMGTLMLTDTHGELLWIPVLHEDLKELQPGERNDMSKIRVTESVTGSMDRTLGDIFNDLWPDCMRESLDRFHKEILDGKFVTAENQYMISVCRLWNEIGTLIGPYEKLDTVLERPVSLEELMRE